MRLLIIALAVVGLGFVAFMLIGSNERQPSGGSTDDYEPPSVLAWLDTDRGAPRLVSQEVRFPRDSGDRLGFAVSEACGTPARLATFVLASGTDVRIAYTCEPQPRERSCSGPASLCRQALCVVASEADKGSSRCDEDLTFVGEAELSIGPERGRIVITPPANGTAEVVLR